VTVEDGLGMDRDLADLDAFLRFAQCVQRSPKSRQGRVNHCVDRMEPRDLLGSIRGGSDLREFGW
jgi:hypothetical protein